MKKIIQKISSVLQVVLLAPVKLPGKALDILKYIALGLGVMERVLDQDENSGNKNSRKSENVGENVEDKIVVEEIDVKKREGDDENQ